MVCASWSIQNSLARQRRWIGWICMANRSQQLQRCGAGKAGEGKGLRLQSWLAQVDSHARVHAGMLIHGCMHLLQSALALLARPQGSLHKFQPCQAVVGGWQSQGQPPSQFSGCCEDCAMPWDPLELPWYLMYDAL